MSGKRDYFSRSRHFSAAKQFYLNTVFCKKIVESTQKFADFQISITKASLQHAHLTIKQLLDVQNPQQLTLLTVAQVLPVSNKTVAYGCHLAGIAVNTQAKWADLLVAQLSDNGNEMAGLIAEAVPAGTHGFAYSSDGIQAMIGLTNATYEQLALVTRQAYSLLETNLHAAANQFAQAGEYAMPAFHVPDHIGRAESHAGG